METRVLGTRLRAVRAALRLAEETFKRLEEMQKHEEICLHIYASLGIINVFEVEGRKRTQVGSFGWPVKETP